MWMLGEKSTKKGRPSEMLGNGRFARGRKACGEVACDEGGR